MLQSSLGTFWGDGKVLDLDLVVVAQVYTFVKAHGAVCSNLAILLSRTYMSVKLITKRPPGTWAPSSFPPFHEPWALASFSDLCHLPPQNLPRSTWTAQAGSRIPLWLWLGTSYAWMSLSPGTLLPL